MNQLIKAIYDREERLKEFMDNPLNAVLPLKGMIIPSEILDNEILNASQREEFFEYHQMLQDDMEERRTQIIKNMFVTGNTSDEEMTKIVEDTIAYNRYYMCYQKLRHIEKSLGK